MHTQRTRAGDATGESACSPSKRERLKTGAWAEGRAERWEHTARAVSPRSWFVLPCAPGTVISNFEATLLDTLRKQGWTPPLPSPGYSAWSGNPHFSESEHLICKGGTFRVLHRLLGKIKLGKTRKAPVLYLYRDLV